MLMEMVLEMLVMMMQMVTVMMMLRIIALQSIILDKKMLMVMVLEICVTTVNV